MEEALTKIFKQTYAYDRYLRNKKNLQFTFEEYEKDIVLDILTIMNYMADIPQLKASVEKFLANAGKFMPNGGEGYDGGLELEYYTCAYAISTLYYNFCSLTFIAKLNKMNNLEEDVIAYAGKHAQEIYNEIKISHFNFNLETALRVINVIAMMFKKYENDLPYIKGEGYNLNQRKELIQNICEELESPYFEEIWNAELKSANS